MISPYITSTGNLTIAPNSGTGSIYFDGNQYNLDNNGILTVSKFVDIQGGGSYYLDPASATTSLTTAGNIGIGTTSPVAQLQVSAGNGANAAAIINQKLSGAILSASASGTTEFMINNDGSITLTGQTTAPTTENGGSIVPGTIYFNTTTTGSTGATVGALYYEGEDNAFHNLSSGTTMFSTSSAAVANGSYLTLVDNQNTNDVISTGWVYDTLSSTWRSIEEFSHSIIQNLSNQWNTAVSSGVIRTTIKQTDVELSQSVDTGTGEDGSITVSSSTNINTTNLISGRTCTDGGDAVNYSVTALTSTTATLSTTPSSGCLGVGDEILLINLQGTSSAYSNVGKYETLIIQQISTNVITFTTSKLNYYGDNATDDTNIGTATTNQRVMLQRVPNYTNVTVNTGINFTPTAWNNVKNGVMFFRASGTVSVVGNLSANTSGYAGGCGGPAPNQNDGCSWRWYKCATIS